MSLSSDDRDFFDKLTDEYSDRIFSIAYGTLAKYGKANRADAEDITQDTLIKILKNIKRFYGLEREDLIPLIVIYTRNTAIDFLRRQKRGFGLFAKNDNDDREFDIPDPSPLPDELVIRNETIDRCAECIDALPESQRAAVILKYRYGYRDREIASVLGIRESAVSSRLNRARETIRKMMGEYFDE